MENIFKEIREERKRQHAKWGVQNHSPIEWLPILLEEVGEVNKAVLEEYFKYPEAPGDYSLYREELIQVAAVVVQILQAFDGAQIPNRPNNFIKE